MSPVECHVCYLIGFNSGSELKVERSRNAGPWFPPPSGPRFFRHRPKKIRTDLINLLITIIQSYLNRQLPLDE